MEHALETECDGFANSVLTHYVPPYRLPNPDAPLLPFLPDARHWFCTADSAPFAYQTGLISGDLPKRCVRYALSKWVEHPESGVSIFR